MIVPRNACFPEEYDTSRTSTSALLNNSRDVISAAIVAETGEATVVDSLPEG
jgi:hypothetical protein